MRTLVYNSDYFDTTLDGDGDDTLGFAFLAPLIGAAPSIFSAITSLFGGGRKAQFQGSAEIEQAGQQATQAMNQIKAALSANPPQIDPQQAVANAQAIVQQFNDPKIVYPAKKGDDARIRTGYIASLNTALQQIQTAAASVAQAQQQAASGGDLLGGISTNTLLLVGGGLLAVMMLSKDNG